MLNSAQTQPHTSAGGRTRARSRVFWRGLLGMALCLAVVVLAIPSSRTFLLRSAGWALVDREPRIDSADVIVVAIDAGGAGTLEAADLVHRGVAERVAVFHDPPTAADQEFLR